jgi:succinoglycan biosynthesis transport protein ExoP
MHKSLLSALERPLDGKVNQVIAVTSSLPREGKTTSTMCLAAMASHLGRRVLLVDCDQRRRSVTRALVDKAQVGIAEVLRGTASLDAAIQKAPAKGVDFLPASLVPAADIDIFTLDSFPALIATLRQRYDLILLDTAPIRPVADTRLVVPHVDSVLFVARWRSTSRKAVHAALRVLGSIDAVFAGITLSIVDLRKQAKFGYGDASFYYQQYKDYYDKVA